MPAAGVAGHTGGEQAARVACLGRHDAVGGHQDGAVKAVKLFLLLPPGVAVVAREVLIAFEEGVVLGGQHLGVGIYIHALTSGLLQQHLQILQVVAGDQDAGPVSHANVYTGDLGVAVGGGIGLIQQRHALHPGRAGIQHQLYQIGDAQAVVHGFRQGGLDEGVHFLIFLQQNVGML